MESLTIDPATTALVWIDLQKGIVGRPLQPHAAQDVVKRAAKLADEFRAAGAVVVLVHVTFSKDGRDALRQPVDEPMRRPDGALPPDWSDFLPEIGPRDGDILITKRNWGAFYGTELELQLRRRGVKTIVIGGIATNFGVESTARDAYERGFELIFVEDAMASLSAEAHQFAVKQIFPRIGRVRTSEQIKNVGSAAGREVALGRENVVARLRTMTRAMGKRMVRK